MPIERRRITLPGVKPIQEAKPGYEYFYLYGAVEPETGQRFFTEHGRLNSDCFQVFLGRLAEAFPRSHNVLVLDNGQFHKAKKLSIPKNVELEFLPRRVSPTALTSGEPGSSPNHACGFLRAMALRGRL